MEKGGGRVVKKREREREQWDLHSRWHSALLKQHLKLYTPAVSTSEDLQISTWPVFPVPQQASTQTQYHLKYFAESAHHELFIAFSLLVCIISLIWIWHWCQIRHAYSSMGYWLTFGSNNESSLELFCIRLDFHFWLTAAVKGSTWLWFWSFQYCTSSICFDMIPSTFREFNL